MSRNKKNVPANHEGCSHLSRRDFLGRSVGLASMSYTLPATILNQLIGGKAVADVCSPGNTTQVGVCYIDFPSGACPDLQWPLDASGNPMSSSELANYANALGISSTASPVQLGAGYINPTGVWGATLLAGPDPTLISPANWMSGFLKGVFKVDLSAMCNDDGASQIEAHNWIGLLQQFKIAELAGNLNMGYSLATPIGFGPSPAMINISQSNISSLEGVVTVPTTNFTSQSLMDITVTATSSLGSILSPKRAKLYNSDSYFNQLLCALGVLPAMTGSYGSQMWDPTKQNGATTTISGLNGVTVSIPASYFSNMAQDSLAAFMGGYQSSMGRVSSISFSTNGSDDHATSAQTKQQNRSDAARWMCWYFLGVFAGSGKGYLSLDSGGSANAAGVLNAGTLTGPSGSTLPNPPGVSQVFVPNATNTNAGDNGNEMYQRTAYFINKNQTLQINTNLGQWTMNNGSVLSSRSTPTNGDLRLAAVADVLGFLQLAGINPSSFISQAEAVGVNNQNASLLMPLIG